MERTQLGPKQCWLLVKFSQQFLAVGKRKPKVLIWTEASTIDLFQDLDEEG